MVLKALLAAVALIPSAAHADLFECVVRKSVPHTELENQVTLVGLSDDKLTVLSPSGASSVYTCGKASGSILSCSSPANGATFDTNGLLSEIANDGSWFVNHWCMRRR